MMSLPAARGSAARGRVWLEPLRAAPGTAGTAETAGTAASGTALLLVDPPPDVALLTGIPALPAEDDSPPQPTSSSPHTAKAAAATVAARTGKRPPFCIFMTLRRRRSINGSGPADTTS